MQLEYAYDKKTHNSPVLYGAPGPRAQRPAHSGTPLPGNFPTVP